MRQQFLGALIGAAFGSVFVLVNSGPPVPSALAWVLRALAVAALGAVIFLGVRAGGRPTLDGRPMFGPSYRIVVVGEVVLLVAGFFVLSLLDAPVQANVAWIATVVGLHFAALAAAWKTPSILVVGVVLTVLGVAGLALLGSAARDWVPFVSGVLSGVTLLGGSLFATGVSARRTGSPRPRA